MGEAAVPAVVESHPAQLPPEARQSLRPEDWRALEPAGLLELDPYELLHGELSRKMSKSRPHSITLLLLIEWLPVVLQSRNGKHFAPSVWRVSREAGSLGREVIPNICPRLVLVKRVRELSRGR